MEKITDVGLKNSKSIQYLQKNIVSLLTILPAAISALLLYGIIFGFILAAYASTPWRKEYTISFYFVVMFFGVIALMRQRLRFLVTRIDLLFIIFLLLVMISTLANWWSGSIHNVLLSSIFFVMPYLLGRIIDDKRALKFMSWLIGFGLILLIILPIENFRMKLPYGDWPSPYIFGQPHGVMLAGLLLSAMFTVIIFRLLLPPMATELRIDLLGSVHGLFLFFLLGLVVIAVVWLQSRGSAIAAVIAGSIMLRLSPYCSLKKKLSIILAFILFLMIAIINPFQNIYGKDFYSAIFQSPKVFLNSDIVNSTQTSEALQDQWSPILGGEACSAIKDSISDRWIHYQTALAIFVKHPVVGVGANHYGDYACTKPGSFPHSTILQAFSELGLIGGGIYLALLFASYKTVFRRYYFSADIMVKAIAAWLLAFLTLQLTVSQLYGNYYFSAGLYFVLGIASRMANEEEKIIAGEI